MEERPNQCYFLSPPGLTEEASEKECGKGRGTWNTLKGNRVSWPSQGTEQEASCPNRHPRASLLGLGASQQEKRLSGVTQASTVSK